MNNNQSKAGTNIQQVRQQNAGQGQFGTEFASETNAAEVRAQNQQSAARNAQSSNAGTAAGQFGTEFASETNVQEVKRQNQQSEANKR